MKKSILLIILLLMSACSPISEKNVENKIASILSDNVNEVNIAPANKNKNYYQYYLPSDIGLKDANETSAILKKNSYNIVFNFSISNLIINEYYTDLSEDSNQENITFKYYTEESFKDLMEKNMLVVKDEIVIEENTNSIDNSEINYDIKKSKKNNFLIYSGYYDSAQHNGLYYELRMKRIHDDYYLHLNGSVATLTSIVPAEEVDNIVNSMLIILKSIRYDKDKLLEKYSKKYDLKVMEEKFKESNDFIYQNLPSEGYLKDLINSRQ